MHSRNLVNCLTVKPFLCESEWGNGDTVSLRQGFHSLSTFVDGSVTVLDRVTLEARLGFDYYVVQAGLELMMILLL